ncbi:hypothetical protein AX15_006275 [Amanita polypyramis BW_CC]|nr:hypothetical protein AX15_006275 [Amanita polypyramis BW_CC]
MSKHITLNDGAQVPWLAFGAGTALFGRDATVFVEQAINTGIVHLDGAQMYTNEETLGNGIKASGKSRSELYIVTKLNEKTPVENIRPSLLVSLQKLGVDYVDLFLVHSPYGYRTEGILTAVWKEVEAIKKEGLAKSIGVSNYKVEDLKVTLENAEIIPAVNQIELHPYVWKAAEPIVKFCAEHGIAIAAYGGQTPIVRASGGPLDSVLESIRVRLEKTSSFRPVTLSHVLTKWLRSKNAIVVTTSSKQSRIKEFIETVSVSDLTPDEIRAIEEAGSKVHKRRYMRHVFGE